MIRKNTGTHILVQIIAEALFSGSVYLKEGRGIKTNMYVEEEEEGLRLTSNKWT